MPEPTSKSVRKKSRGLFGFIAFSVIAGVLIAASVTPAVALTTGATSGVMSLFGEIPDSLDVTAVSQKTTIYAVNPATGQEEPMTSFYDQNRSPVTFDQVAPVMYDAILSSEDPRFYEHGGVDFIGTARALISNLSGKSVQGGSSISQQYVKNILVQECEQDPEKILGDDYQTATKNSDSQSLSSSDISQMCFNKVTAASGMNGIARKLQEMRYAIALEQKYSKNEILIGYLNIANFGGVNYGIDAAARYYFGVPASDLNLSQAAALAGMVQNPNTYRIDRPDGSTTDKDGNRINSAADGYSLTKGRQTYVLNRMLDDGKITKEQHDEAVSAPIQPNITQPKTGCAVTGAPYFCEYVKSVMLSDKTFGDTPEERAHNLRTKGYKVYTTLDWNLQNASQDALSKLAPAYIDGMNFGAASAQLQPGTGKVLAITQNTTFDPSGDDPGHSTIVYAGNLQNGGSRGFSAGSTFKLFTLIAWLEAGHSLNEYVNGTLRPIGRMKNSCDGDWVNTNNTLIHNFGQSHGFVGTPKQFTAESLNTGFLAMAEQLDMCDISKVAARLGVTLGNGDPIDIHTAFQILGSDAVSPIQMAAAYATVASGGKYCPPNVITKITDSSGTDLPIPDTTCKQVLDPDVAAAAALALQGVMNGGTGNGGNPYDGTPLIGKTGTHEDLQTWIMESSTKLTSAIWVGNASGDASLTRHRAGRYSLNNLRYPLGKAIQGAADKIYGGGDEFQKPSDKFTKTVTADLPSVLGMTIDEAKNALKAAGFWVTVGDPVLSDQAAGTIVTQDPPAGRVASGSVITISPSDGKGAVVPVVSGMSLENTKAVIQAAGLVPVVGTCTAIPDNGATPSPGSQTTVNGLEPGARTVVPVGSQVTINYSKRGTCP